MTGYIRNDTSNNIADSNVINAADLDGEFDALVAAFNASTGHSHDGTAAEGSPITVTGPAQEFLFDGTAIYPKSDGLYDLGKSAAEFKDLFIDGVANVDSLVADTADINGGTIDATVIGAGTPAAGSFTTGAFTGNLSVPQLIVNSGADTGTVAIRANNNTQISHQTLAAGTVGSYYYNQPNTAHFFTNGGVVSARLDPVGTSVPSAQTIITREKGDARYINKAGDTVTGNTTYNDNIKAIFGTGGDLEIFHDGSHSYINDVGTGELRIRASDKIAFQNIAGTSNMAIFKEAGECSLNFNSGVRLSTAFDGVEINVGGLLLNERAAHGFTPAAGKAEIWVKNTAPTSPFFTSDTGVDTKLAGTAINETISGDWTFSGTVALPAGTVDTAEIADDAVTTAKILDANVTTAKVADDAITDAKVLHPSGMVFISSQDASASATLDFTGFDATKYDAYEFVLSNVKTAAAFSDTLRIRTSADGSTWEVAANAYAYGYTRTEATGSATPTGVGDDSSSLIALSIGIGHEDAGFSGRLRLDGPHLAQKTVAHWTGGYFLPSGGLVSVTGVGARLSSAAVLGVQFAYVGGNIASGTITMYGLRNS